MWRHGLAFVGAALALSCTAAGTAGSTARPAAPAPTRGGPAGAGAPGAARSSASASVAASDPRLLPALAARALPSVVLVLNVNPKGHTHYGAGVLVGPARRVLTSLHVVQGGRYLRVLLYRPGRASYTPMEGGLGRYIFENARELRVAHLVKRDPSVDLALLSVDGDLSAYPAITFATEPVHVGDPVLALGHPGESVWSFTAGVVGALPKGFIQHDAPVSQGNSGGPLVNLNGELVGITTAKVLSGVPGVAFATPISAIRRLLRATPGDNLDLTDLERAVLACVRAEEIRSPRAPECLDPKVQWRLYQEAVAAVALDLRLDAAGRAGFARALLASGPETLARRRQGVWQVVLGVAAGIEGRRAACAREVADPRCARPHALDPIRRRAIRARAEVLLARALAEVARLRARTESRVRADTRLEVDLADARAFTRTLRMGIRIDAIRHRGPKEAWVLLSGRNVDGSTYHLTEHWRRRGDQWRRQIPVLDGVLGDRPAGWPRPLGDEALSSSAYRAEVLAVVAAPCCLPGPVLMAAPSARGDR